MSISAAIYGLQGETLAPDEKAFFRDADPWGFILFARNIDRPNQVKALTDSLRDCVGRNAPVFIDQEGGRVQRLKPPVWRAAPPAERFGVLWEREPECAIEAVRLNHQMLGAELIAVGVDADCAPCLDIRVPGAHDVIGDRAFHTDPDPVRALGAAALDGLLDQGVLGVIKHIPGHGRAGVDSHLDLPVVDADLETLTHTDFAAFQGLDNALMAMTAHVIYSALDPEACATHSADVIARIIRDLMGFDGVLMSDDLSMQALSGSLQQRGERALSAGCDMVLHCNGVMAEMVAVAHGGQRLDGAALSRSEAALAARKPALEFDAALAGERLDQLFLQAGLEAVS